MNKPKLLFVYEHKKPEWWLDGLSAALDVLEKDFEITKENLDQHHDGFSDGSRVSADFILGWGSFGSAVDLHIKERAKYFGIKKGLCVAGNASLVTSADNYDILFFESDWIKENYLKDVTTKTVKAFGVNTDIYFKQDIPNPIVWDYIGVGAFASWKRWERFNSLQGKRLVIGEYQLGNETESLSIARDLIKHGVMVSDMVHPFDLANLYNWSRTLFIPADINGGGERAILEARSCGLDIKIENDNPKLKELLDCPIPSHIDYAEQLKKGIMSCL